MQLDITSCKVIINAHALEKETGSRSGCVTRLQNTHISRVCCSVQLFLISFSLSPNSGKRKAASLPWQEQRQSSRCLNELQTGVHLVRHLYGEPCSQHSPCVMRFWISFRILNTTLFESWELIGPYPSWWLFNGLLVTLQILHIIWSYLIIRTAYKALVRGKVRLLATGLGPLSYEPSQSYHEELGPSVRAGAGSWGTCIRNAL